MFCYQPNFFSQTEPVTPELFAKLIISDAVVNRIRSYRQQRPRLELLKEEIRKREARMDGGTGDGQLKAEVKKLKAECSRISQEKTGLPSMLFQVSAFEVTVSKKGYAGRWRKQQAARLNGLFIIDVDHIDQPRELFRTWVERFGQADGTDSAGPQDAMPGTTLAERARQWAAAMGILLVHVTSSDRGLRLVAKADPAIGNIADNQTALATRLGVQPDAACKDASRASFCPMFEDILLINKDELFNYDNKDYDEKFGPQYRSGDSQPRSGDSHKAPAAPTAGSAGTATAQDDSAGTTTAQATCYHGRSYHDIACAWFRQNGGEPKAGDRHQTLYRLACDLRYITDFDPQLLARILAECKVGRDVACERGRAELDRIASDACALQHYRTIPRRLQTVLQSLGLQQDDTAGDTAPAPEAPIDYRAWWLRLQPLLVESPVLREAVATMPEEHRLAGVLAAGAMLGTYLTRCWWEHFDGKDYRLSFLVYIIGSAASGKSFVTEMDRLIMAPMLAADRVGREWERQYKEDIKKRAASTKNARQDAPDQQHPMIRYVPSTISNAMLYRRLTDAVEQQTTGPDGQPMHVHLYTMEPELATALRAQQGSWAGKNDLELKSFHNEYAGVDYANDQSTNGIIQVNWNQVVTGTQEAMNRKIRPSMVLDGLVTRLALFPMPQNDFQMIERRRAVRNHEREALLRSIGLTLEQVRGELRCDRLVDYCYDYERRLTDDARLEQDLCLDYFRKRIPVLMMRYTLVRIVCRMVTEERVAPAALHELSVRDDDLEFARLIGDWTLMAQMHLYGQMVLEAQQRERDSFVPRKRSRKIREAYALLPGLLTTEVLVSQGISADLNKAGNTLRRWLADGLVELTDNKKVYRKKYREIPV